MSLSHLGTPTGPMTRIHGGYANRTYRLDTDQGSFAIKELNLIDRRQPYHAEQVFRLEQTAFAAGIPMPEPISATPGTLVHRWVDGETVPEAPAQPSYAFEVGEILAQLHALNVPWTDQPDEPTPHDWPELTARATATSQPWADELASHTETLLAIAHFLDTCDRPGPLVLTHKDIQPWNLLSRKGRPVLLDWELSGKLDLSAELGATALSLAKGPGLDDINPAIFHTVLNGYTAAGGTLPPRGPSWFTSTISGWLNHTRWNILRCLTATEPTTGPTLALSHEAAWNGLRGLPELFARLPELEELLG